MSKFKKLGSSGGLAVHSGLLSVVLIDSQSQHVCPRRKTWVSNFDQTCEQYRTETRFTPGYKECASRAPGD